MSDEVGKTPPTVAYRLQGDWAHLGPLSEAQVRELIARGKASNATLATIGDDPTLTPLGEISAFADCFATELAAPSSVGAPKAQLPALSPHNASALIIPDAASAKPGRALPRWALAAAAVAAIVLGLAQLYGRFVGDALPACDSPAAVESALNGLKPQHEDFARAATLRDIRSLSSGEGQRFCAASLVSTTGDRPASALEYRVFLENKAVRAEVTKADFPPATQAPAATGTKAPVATGTKAPVATAPKPHAAPGGDSDAEACHLKGEPDRVIAACSRLLARDALDGVLRRDAFRSRGVAYYRRGDYDRALADLAESIRLAPDVAGLYGDQANVYYFKRDYSRAIAGYDKALQLDPNDALAYNNRGCAWVAVGSLAAAEADFNRARQRGVADPGGVCKAALVSLRSSQHANP
jgi:tetratricopeptide (TPR) repeat protein